MNTYSGKNNIGSVNLKNNLNYPVTKNLMPGMDDLDRLILPADSEVSLEKIKNDFDYSEEKSYPEESEKENSFWDTVSTILAAASIIPGADMVTNLLSIPVDLIRGDYLSAGLDALGVIPFAGEFADAAKVAGKVDDVADIVNAAKKADNIADAAKVWDKAHDVTNVTAKFNENISPYKIEPTHSLTLSKNKYAELVDDIKKNGITEPIKYVEHNGIKYVVDGHHRLQAAKDLKLKDIPVEKVSLPYKGYKNISDLEWYN